MGVVVQAKCPNCGKLLRIPADWVNQAMRCKHCGQPFQAKQALGIKPAIPAAPPADRIPDQYRKVAVSRNVQTATPPPVQAAPQYTVPVAQAVPVATPVTAAPAPAALFGDLDLDASTDTSPARLRRRRNQGKPWVLPVVLLVLLGGLGATVAIFWSNIAAVFDDKKVAKNNDDDDKRSDTQTRDGGPKTTDGRPKDGKDSGRPKDGSRPIDQGEPPASASYPRRALIISVHNYLYANPTNPGLPGVSSRNITNQLKKSLNNGLKIPLTQIAHLSDDGPKGQARSPLKAVIRDTLTSFLNTCRAQDRILVFFIGHAVTLNDEAYLVPIEGELDNADTLIPLKWVYHELETCKARQKVLILDVNRFSPTDGLERPDSGPMTAKFDGILQKPPAGVQVWTACTTEQQSLETDDCRMGVFLDYFCEAISNKPGKSLQGKIQWPRDPYPLEQLVPLVNKLMEAELKPLKLTQVSRLSGKEPGDGAAYDSKEAAPPTPQLAAVPTESGGQANMQIIRSVLEEIGVPPVKVSKNDNTLKFEMLPPFAPKAMEKFAGGPAEDSKVKAAIMKARAVLWATASEAARDPAGIAGDIKKMRQDLKVTLNVMRDGYRAPANENMFKTAVMEDQKQVAKIMLALKEALEEMEAAADDRDKESKRWQANYDFTLARLQSQIAYLYEYESMLGQMRKELPPRDPAVHTGWKLAARTELNGDSNGKRIFKDSRKLLDKMIKSYAGTPWEVLAKREKLTAIGLKWEASRSQ
jgi:hypothetical protein